MQLGTRWAMGDEPPTRLPAAVVAAIRTVEGSFDNDAPLGSGSSSGSSSGGSSTRFDTSRRWTLTWLEGRPFLELDPDPDSDDVTVIRYSPTKGTTSITTGDSDEEWVEE
ncbi:MAG: hypothetical protein ABI238_01550 [Terrimesophilobacter sp.]